LESEFLILPILVDDIFRRFLPQILSIFCVTYLQPAAGMILTGELLAELVDIKSHFLNIEPITAISVSIEKRADCFGKPRY